jgi:hypothetical protein
MYQLNAESVQKLVEINKLLELIEVKGYSNVGILYSAMTHMQDVLTELQKQSQGIVVDNTKGDKK